MLVDMYPILYTGVAKEVSETWQSRACTHLPAICVRFNITLSLLSLHGKNAVVETTDVFSSI